MQHSLRKRKTNDKQLSIRQAVCSRYHTHTEAQMQTSQTKTSFLPGDLCRPTNTLGSGNIILSVQEELYDVLVEVDSSAMLMVTEVRETTATSNRSLAQISRAGQIFYDPQDVRVLQVIIASGPHAGAVGYVPSYWLSVILRP